MLDKYLTNDEIRDIFCSAMFAKAIEKRAVSPAVGAAGGAAAVGGIDKFVDMVSKGLGKAPELTKDVAELYMKSIPLSAATSLLLGGAAGGLYHIVKEKMTESGDEQISANNKLQALYNARSAELEDQKWMSKVRKMRDDLKKNMKNMTADEYEAQYNALSEALDERRG